MKKLYASVSVVTLLGTLLFSFVSWRTFDDKPVYATATDFPITICGSALFSDEYFNSPVTLLDGLGDLHYRITTKDSLAQKFFDQGLRLVYGFNHVEALRAFREASRLDPACAMAFWGQALTLGPNINDWNPKDREAMALEAITKARELTVNATQKEKDLIKAMSARYDGKAYDVRDNLNNAYRLAMEAVSKKYPQDPEALTLYADAIMTSMPWDYWNADGSPKTLTTLARKALETAISKHKRHPGAHHLYIHLVEASKKPSDARNSAEFLETAMPSAGHIVHMPSHIYVRTGEYERSNNSNREAVKVDEEFLSRTNDQGLYRVGYYPHNIDFLVFGALMDGQSAIAIKEGNKLAYHMDPLRAVTPAYFDYYSPMPLVSMVRYGKWNEILALPLPEGKVYQATALQHFGRGMAFVRKNNMEEADNEWKKLDSINRLDTLKTIYAFFNSTHQITNVATEILKGEIFLHSKKTDEAIASLKAAVAAEDGLRYNEPPDWRIPARHFLGAALIEVGKYGDAEKVFMEDLAINPENGWSLQGLLQCQLKLGKVNDSKATQQRFEKAWKNADVKISTSRF